MHKPALILFSLLSLLDVNALGVKLQQSDYFETRTGGFVPNTENKTIVYAITLLVNTPPPVGSVLEFRFQNPLRKSKPLLKDIYLEAEQEEIRVISDPVWGLRNGNSYQIEAILYESEAKKNRLSVHKQTLLFRVLEKYFNQYIKPWYQGKKG
tara:strand:- start:563 stop:1021 length:459 start_codon:yes stop_codon:yes gene_type:complete